MTCRFGRASIQQVELLRLLLPNQLRGYPVHKLDTIRRVGRGSLIGLMELDGLRPRKAANQVEKPVASPVAVILDDHQRLVDEPPDEIQENRLRDLRRVDRTEHRQREPASENRGGPQQMLLLRSEEPVSFPQTPGHCLMPAWTIKLAAPQEREAGVHLSRDVCETQIGDSRRRELDGQRQAVEPLNDRAQLGCIT